MTNTITANQKHAQKAALPSSTAPHRRVGDGDADAGGGAIRLISKPEVLDRVGVSYPTLWAWMRKGKFPRSRELGGKAAWIEGEVEAWIAALPVRRLKGDEAA